ncbi:MAG: hypothetical protein ACREJ2_11305 [Planctomycetota bacterium]
MTRIPLSQRAFAWTLKHYVATLAVLPVAIVFLSLQWNTTARMLPPPTMNGWAVQAMWGYPRTCRTVTYVNGTNWAYSEQSVNGGPMEPVFDYRAQAQIATPAWDLGALLADILIGLSAILLAAILGEGLQRAATALLLRLMRPRPRADPFDQVEVPTHWDEAPKP